VGDRGTRVQLDCALEDGHGPLVLARERRGESERKVRIGIALVQRDALLGGAHGLLAGSSGRVGPPVDHLEQVAEGEDGESSRRVGMQLDRPTRPRLSLDEVVPGVLEEVPDASLDAVPGVQILGRPTQSPANLDSGQGGHER
jgi:hypothetical protein